nr:Hypothetical protein SC2p2_00850 [Methylocystis sp. SC2]
MAVRQESRAVSRGKNRRLGRLIATDFDSFGPKVRSARIMSDKRTLSDMGMNRQARRVVAEIS